MQGNINAAGIIIIFFVSVLILNKYNDKNLINKNLFKAVLTTSLISFICMATSIHMCNAGNPVVQWLIPCISIFFFLLVIENRKIKLAGVILLFIAAITLSQHYTFLVHGNGYYGNKYGNLKEYKSILNNYKSELSKFKEIQNKKFDPGWMHEVFNEYLKNNKGYDRGYDVYLKPQKQWHTKLTKLYKTTENKSYIYYPGGILKDNIKYIEFRVKEN